MRPSRYHPTCPECQRLRASLVRCNGRTRPLLLTPGRFFVRPSLSDRRLGEDLRVALRAGLHTVPGSLCRSISALLVPVDACNTFCSPKARACQGWLSSWSVSGVETAGPGKDISDERSFGDYVNDARYGEVNVR